MLEQLVVKDFALSHENTIELSKGMTSITGETGTGKSLTVDALELVLGGRASAEMVKRGADKAEISAVFSLPETGKIREKLRSFELDPAEDALLLRRTISCDGKSKAYINGSPCTLAMLRDIGGSLVAVHGQHASVKLVDTDEQRNLLDDYGRLHKLLQDTNQAFFAYNTKRQQLSDFALEQQQGAAKFKTLRFEIDELKKLDLKEGSYEEISSQYDALMHVSQTENAVALALGVLDNDEHNVIEILSSRIRDLDKVKAFDENSINPVIESLSCACEELDKARNQLSNLSTRADPQKTQALSERLSKCHELSRRFGVEPKNLFLQLQRLEDELGHFLSLRDKIASLTDEVRSLRAEYERLALELSDKRKAAAQSMSLEVTKQLSDLAMPDGIFRVEVKRDEEIRPRRDGRDEVVFVFSANRGETPRELASVASGGELSRLALAIEVLTSSANSTPTLIFDEVDTGISGRTASSVGKLLHELGKKVQVITVTHLPQVAAVADNQFLVKKITLDDKVSSCVQKLDFTGRVEEIARMMGGEVITDATLESARALLSAHED